MVRGNGGGSAWSLAVNYVGDTGCTVHGDFFTLLSSAKRRSLRGNLPNMTLLVVHVERLHPMTPLEFRDEPPYANRSFDCDLCCRRGDGPVFHCKTCQYDLHEACCTLQPTLRIASADAHPHAHPLKLESAYASSKKKCDGCRKPLAEYCEWSYRCETCNFDLHARCAKLRKNIWSFFHPHPLKLLKKSPYPPRRLQCDLCDERMPTDGWVYHCTSCKFDLHPSCAQLPPDPLCSAHPHRLSRCRHRTFQGKGYVCDVCRTSGGELGFQCDKCNFNIHPKCLESLFLPGANSDLPSKLQSGSK